MDNLLAFSATLARVHAGLPVTTERRERMSAPTASELMKHALDNAHNLIPMLVLAANEAPTREALDAQTEIVEALIKELRHGLYSVIALQGDLRFQKFSRFPGQE